MPGGRIYTDVVTIDGVSIFNVTANPDTVLSADLGSLAIRSDSPNQALYQNQDGATSWIQIAPGAGSGDVVGPAVATADALARFNGTTGKVIKNSSAVLTDAGVLTVPVLITGDLEMQSEERNASWLFREHAEYIEVTNQKTGMRYKMALVPIGEE